MSGENDPDVKIFSVPATDPHSVYYRELRQLPEHLLAQIRHFFDIYKELEPRQGDRRPRSAGPALLRARDHRRTEAVSAA
jgi:inorganic pyrophosphatase